MGHGSAMSIQDLWLSGGQEKEQQIGRLCSTGHHDSRLFAESCVRHRLWTHGIAVLPRPEQLLHVPPLYLSALCPAYIVDQTFFRKITSPLMACLDNQYR